MEPNTRGELPTWRQVGLQWLSSRLLNGKAAAGCKQSKVPVRNKGTQHFVRRHEGHPLVGCDLLGGSARKPNTRGELPTWRQVGLQWLSSRLLKGKAAAGFKQSKVPVQNKGTQHFVRRHEGHPLVGCDPLGGSARKPNTRGELPTWRQVGLQWLSSRLLKGKAAAGCKLQAVQGTETSPDRWNDR
jgi:hypothetical protein